MPKFSEISKKRLDTCHQYLQDICNEAIKDFDFTVVEGHRGEDKQNAYFEENLSDLRWPHSKHNKWPSYAVDLVPYRNGKCQWEDERAYHYLAGLIIGIGLIKGIKIRWGGRWKTRVDMPHFELCEMTDKIIAK